jgi:hypothetical protein
LKSSGIVFGAGRSYSASCCAESMLPFDRPTWPLGCWGCGCSMDRAFVQTPAGAREPALVFVERGGKSVDWNEDE